MTGLALAVLIGVGALGVWDILEPDALKMKINSPARGVAGLLVAGATVALILMVLHASAAVAAVVVAGLICLACLPVALR